MSVRVALIQVAITDDEPVPARIARVLSLTADVAATHDVVVLPELWPIGSGPYIDPTGIGPVMDPSGHSAVGGGS